MSVPFQQCKLNKFVTILFLKLFLVFSTIINNYSLIFDTTLINIISAEITIFNSKFLCRESKIIICRQFPASIIRWIYVKENIFILKIYKRNNFELPLHICVSAKQDSNVKSEILILIR